MVGAHDRGDRGCMQTAPARPVHESRRDTSDRRGPRWWWIVLVQLAGTWAAAVLTVIAWFSLPDYGLFGVPNDGGAQVLGLLAAIGAIPCLLSGPIFVWAVRRWRQHPTA